MGCDHGVLRETGNPIHNANVSANMMRSKFYVCPVCGNVIHSMGEGVIGCHGIQLSPLSAEPSDEQHMIFVERSDDEYYVRIGHVMTIIANEKNLRKLQISCLDELEW